MNKPDDLLVLIVEDEQTFAEAMALYLEHEGMKTARVSNGAEAVLFYEQFHPQVIVTDLCMPVMGGLELIETLKKMGNTVPVIVLTGKPDMETAIGALQQGAYDYLLKPLSFEVLVEKVRKAHETTRLTRENYVLSELVSMYTLTSKLAASHNLDELLDIAFRYSLEFTNADGASIRLFDEGSGEWQCARQASLQEMASKLPDGIAAREAIISWIGTHAQTLFIENGIATTALNLHPSCSSIHALIAVPLKSAGKIVGAIVVEREKGHPLFSTVDTQLLEVLASQVTIAFSNAHLYASLSKKLEELKIVSSYSESLMGRIDRYEMIRCLFDRVREHCAIDIIGFLLVQRRQHDFLYWSRGSVDEADIWEICKQVISSYNDAVNTKISERRVHLKQVLLRQKERGQVRFPLGFRHIAPVVWEDTNMGAFFIGSAQGGNDSLDRETLVTGLINQTRIAFVNAKLYHDMNENYVRTIKALAIAVDAKDNYTRGHSEKVMAIAEEVAREIKNVDDRHVDIIRDAALLHDIGKIGIPGNILNKRGPLTDFEFNNVMKTHCAMGANIIREVPFLHELYKLVLYHHEHWDGSGYPEGLRGDDIPIGARILHVADAYDAMLSDRPYRSSLGNTEAIKRLVADSGRQFDPLVIGAFLRVARKKGLVTQ